MDPENKQITAEDRKHAQRIGEAMLVLATLDISYLPDGTAVGGHWREGRALATRLLSGRVDTGKWWNQQSATAQLYLLQMIGPRRCWGARIYPRWERMTPWARGDFERRLRALLAQCIHIMDQADADQETAAEAAAVVELHPRAKA